MIFKSMAYAVFFFTMRTRRVCRSLNLV